MAVEDWLLKEIRKLTQLLLTLLSKTSELKIDFEEEKVSEIKKKLENELEIRIDELLSKDDNSMIAILVNKKFTLEHLELFADLLSELNSKNTRIENTAEKALAIYDYVQKQNTTYSIALYQKTQKLLID